MAHVDNVRRHFPAVRTNTYLNTGTFGALPDVAVERMHGVLEGLLREGRSLNYYHQLATVEEQVIEQLGHLLNVPVASLTLTDSTTHGINIVLWGIDWKPGDEIVFSTSDHLSTLVPVFSQKMRRGVAIRRFDVHRQTDQTIASLKSVLSPRTRLVVFPHVSHETGLRLPIEEMIQEVHRHGALALVDGAQGAGAEFLDLRATSADFYAFPGHKWLLGPDGVGALYVRPEVSLHVDMTYGGQASLRANHPYGADGYFLPLATGRRHEHHRHGMVNWIGWLESLKFLRITVGWDYAWSRIHGLSGLLIEQLLDVPGIEVLTPRDARAGIVSFRMKDIAASRIGKLAAERQVMVKEVPALDAIRVCTGLYNAEEDIQNLMNILKREELQG